MFRGNWRAPRPKARFAGRLQRRREDNVTLPKEMKPHVSNRALDKEGNDMNKLMTAIAAALVAMVMAAPVHAQMRPTVTINSGPSDNANLPENQPGDSIGCTGGFDVVLSRNVTQDTTVRVMLRQLSGHDYFRKHGVQAFYIEGVDIANVTRTIRTFTISSGQRALSSGFNVCWLDDIIDSGFISSQFEMRVLSIPGYDTSSAVRTYNITENDDCTQPNLTPGGVVYKFRNGNMNDSCVCATKSLVEAPDPYDGYTPLTPGRGGLNRDPVVYGDIPTYGESSLKWTNDSTDYCEESPYQRPG